MEIAEEIAFKLMPELDFSAGTFIVLAEWNISCWKRRSEAQAISSAWTKPRLSIVIQNPIATGLNIHSKLQPT